MFTESKTSEILDFLNSITIKRSHEFPSLYEDALCELQRRNYYLALSYSLRLKETIDKES